MNTLTWAVADGWTLTRRNLLHWARQPGQTAVALLFPVMLVLMFAYVLGGSMDVGGDYKEFLLHGMFAMTMAFGLEGTFTAVAQDAGKGVTDRFRSMPMSGSAVVVGRAAADMLQSVVVLAVMLGCGLLVGWEWHNGLGKALAAAGLLMLLRFAFLWMGIYLGLVAPGPDAVMAVQILVWPFAFLSNVFSPPSGMPGWLGFVAEINPLSATVSATRELFGNPGVGGESWAAQHSLLLAVVWPLVIVAVFFPLSVRRYRDLSR